MDENDFGFEQLLVSAIEMNYRLRLTHAGEAKRMSPAEFVQEFGTVVLDVGRRVGKTTAIARLATSVDVIIVRNQDEKKRFPSTHGTVLTRDEALRPLSAHRLRSDSTIWVDETYGQPRIPFFTLLMMHARSPYQTFVILGTPPG